MIRRSQLAVIGIVSSFAVMAQAEQVMYMFPLDAAQEVQNPPVVSPGTGFGHVMYDTETNAIDWSISFQGLLSNVIASHFHGPAIAGQNAGVILGVTAPSAMSGLIEGSGTFPQAQEQALLDGLVYFNIHTSGFTGGEIRGQVVPEPATLALFLAATAGLFLRRCRS